MEIPSRKLPFSSVLCSCVSASHDSCRFLLSRKRCYNATPDLGCVRYRGRLGESTPPCCRHSPSRGCRWFQPEATAPPCFATMRGVGRAQVTPQPRVLVACFPCCWHKHCTARTNCHKTIVYLWFRMFRGNRVDVVQRAYNKSCKGAHVRRNHLNLPPQKRIT